MEDVGLGEGSSAAVNRFTPFASELDWRVACWAIQDGIGHKSFDRLMAIPGVSAVIYGIEFILLTLYDRSLRSLVCHTRTYGAYTRSLMEYLLVLPGRSESYGSRMTRRISTWSITVIPWRLSRHYWVIWCMLNMWSIGRRRSLVMHLRARGYIMRCGPGTGGTQYR